MKRLSLLLPRIKVLAGTRLALRSSAYSSKHDLFLCVAGGARGRHAVAVQPYKLAKPKKNDFQEASFIINISMWISVLHIYCGESGRKYNCDRERYL